MHVTSQVDPKATEVSANSPTSLFVLVFLVNKVPSSYVFESKEVDTVTAIQVCQSFSLGKLNFVS